MKFGVYNILNQTYKLKMGDESTVNISTPNLLLEDYKKGISYNLSFGIKILNKISKNKNYQLI